MAHQQDLALVRRVTALGQVHLTVMDAVHVLQLRLKLLDLLLVLLDDGFRPRDLLCGSEPPSGRIELVALILEALRGSGAPCALLFEPRLVNYWLLLLIEVATAAPH